MAELSTEQKRALAMAAARKRLSAKSASPDTPAPEAAAPDPAMAENRQTRQNMVGAIPIFGPAINAGMDAVDALNASGGVTPEQEASGEWRRGTLAPVIRNETTGKKHWAWPQIAVDAVDAIQLPGDALSGSMGVEVDPNTMKPTTVTDEMVGRGVNAAAVMAGGNAGTLSRVPLSETPRVAAKGVARETGMSRPASETIVRALEADEALGPSGEAVLKGSDSMLADAGPATAAVLDTALQRSGPGATAARNAIEERAAGAVKIVNEALDEALGPAQGVKATETAIRKGSAGARGASYDEAYAAPIDYSEPAGLEIEALVKRVPGGVIATANRMMQLEGYESAQIMAQIADDGTVTFMRMPDVRQLDYITRALNQSAKSGEGQGALGGQTDIGRAYGNLAKQIRGSVKEAVPAYATALETAAKPIQAREALRFGEGLLAPSVTRSEARELVADMTGPELKAARQGLRSYVDDVLANVRAVASDPNLDAREARKALQDMSSRAAKEKIGMILDGEEQAEKLFGILKQASQALELRASVATNSRTYGRMAMDETISGAIKEGPGNALMRGEPVNALKEGVQTITGRTPAGERRMADAVYEEIANALTQKRGNNALDMREIMAKARYRASVPQGPATPSPLFPLAEVAGQFDR